MDYVRTENQDFAARLLQLRLDRKLTRGELARLADVSPQSLLGWERAICVPKYLSLGRLARALNTSIAFLALGHRS